VTPLDFIKAGVQFTWLNSRVVVRGPDDPKLMASLRAEVERRMPMVDPLPKGRAKGCDCCGEAIPTVLQGGTVNLTSGRGMCQLCWIARWKVVDGKQAAV